MLKETLSIIIMIYAAFMFLSKMNHLTYRQLKETNFVIVYSEKNKQTELDIPDAILAGAWDEVHNRTTYDKTRRGYHPLHYYMGEHQKSPVYPGGDIHPDYGVCSDLIVRSLRRAGYDLQQLIYEDILLNPEAYLLEQRFKQIQPDPNIDHRRTSNQLIFFQRHALQLTTIVDSTTTGRWQPGDIVIWDLDPSDKPPDHAGIISDRLVPGRARPYVIQNNGRTQAVDCLNRKHWKIVGHFRLPKPQDLFASD